MRAHSYCWSKERREKRANCPLIGPRLKPLQPLQHSTQHTVTACSLWNTFNLCVCVCGGGHTHCINHIPHSNKETLEQVIQQREIDRLLNQMWRAHFNYWHMESIHLYYLFTVNIFWVQSTLKLNLHGKDLILCNEPLITIHFLSTP